MENILWQDLKEFMYNLEIEEHLETFWDFLEEKGLFKMLDICPQCGWEMDEDDFGMCYDCKVEE